MKCTKPKLTLYFLKGLGELSSEPLLLCAVWRIFCFGIFIDFFKMGVDFCFSCGY